MRQTSPEIDEQNLTSSDQRVNRKKWLESLVSGALSFRRMVKRKDLLKIFFVYLCLLHVSPGHPCGRNPLSRFQPLTKMLGRDINSLLNLLRNNNPALYQQVQNEWRRYADCVGLVDTGYFKKRSAGLPMPLAETSEEEALHEQAEAAKNDSEIGSSRLALRNRRARKLLMMMMSSLAAAAASSAAGADADVDVDANVKARGGGVTL